MKILVVDHRPSERDVTVCFLANERNDILVAHDASGALAILDEREIDVVVVESTLPDVNGAALVRRIRSRESARRRYVIVSASRPLSGDLRLAFAAGADDFIRKPIQKDELLVRVDAPNRIRLWASRSLSLDVDIGRLAAWRGIEGGVGGDVCDMFGLRFENVPVENALDGSAEVACLPLTLAAEATEVCVAVGIDHDASRSLAEIALGDPNADIMHVRDMLREIANVAAGAFKRMAANEGMVFTTGMPSETSAGAFRTSTAQARRRWIARAPDAGIVIRFEAEIRTRERKRTPVGGLREGMVVVADLLNEAGALLMRGGTRITESHLGGLRRALGTSALVEVAEAA